MVVTVTMAATSSAPRSPLFREQKRGGKGRSGMATKDEDAVTELFVTSTHNPVLFFSNLGRVYRMKVWRLPEGDPAARGRPMVNLLPLAEGETISTVLPLPEDEAEWGNAPHHVRDRQGHGAPQHDGRLHQHPDRGQDRDEVRGVGGRRRRRRSDRPADRRRPAHRGGRCPARDQNGKAIRFLSTDVREFQSRTSTGVRGVRLLRRRPRSSPCRSCTGVGTNQEEREAYLRAAPVEAKSDRRGTLADERIAELAEQGAVHPHRHRKRLSASAPRPTNIAAPIAAARASPISTHPNATAGWWRASRRSHGEQLMLVTDQAQDDPHHRRQTSASPGATRRA